MNLKRSSSNDTACPVDVPALPQKPFIQQGQITFQAHQVGWIICGFLAAIAVGVSAWLINKHLINYTNKGQQRYIVRCLLLVPIYAVISFISFVMFDTYADGLLLIRDCYESIALHSFFWLLLEYISHDKVEQKEAFREVKIRKWIFPLGFIKSTPDGLYFLQIMKWGVLQYAVLRPLCTILALVLDHLGLYCDISWSPRFAYVYIIVVLSISVSVAMYCLIQLYVPIADRLKSHKPLLKFLAIKSVVFLTFWQSTFLDLLATFKVVKDTPYMTADQINIGIAAILETFEMMCFAFFHLWAFTYKPYVASPSPGAPSKPTSRLRSLGHALDFRDLLLQVWSGVVYAWKRGRGHETDVKAERRSHLQKAIGARRLPGQEKAGDSFLYDTPSRRFSKEEPESYPWLQLREADIGLIRGTPDGFEEEVNAELRRLRMVSEWNRRNVQASDHSRQKRKNRASHRRDTAVSDEQDSYTGFKPLPSRDDALAPRDEPRKERPYWRVLYDRISHGGGPDHLPVPQAEDDDYLEDDLGAPVKQRLSTSSRPEETGLVILSRGPFLSPESPSRVRREALTDLPQSGPALSSESPSRVRRKAAPDIPPPTPPAKDRPAPLARSDTFLRQVFTADVTSEDGYTRSREHSHDLLSLSAPLPWLKTPTDEDGPRASVSGIAVRRVPMGDGDNITAEGRPLRQSLVIPGPSVSQAVDPPTVSSPIRSSHGSVYGPRPLSQSTGPTRPRTGPVLPTPSSPARFPVNNATPSGAVNLASSSSLLPQHRAEILPVLQAGAEGFSPTLVRTPQEYDPDPSNDATVRAPRRQIASNRRRSSSSRPEAEAWPSSREMRARPLANPGLSSPPVISSALLSDASSPVSPTSYSPISPMTSSSRREGYR